MTEEDMIDQAIDEAKEQAKERRHEAAHLVELSGTEVNTLANMLNNEIGRMMQNKIAEVYINEYRELNKKLWATYWSG